MAIYDRVSSDRDGTQTSTGRQERACRALADLRGWSVGAVYEDVDVSAYRQGVVRPQYERLLADINAGLIDGVIVWKLDRLVRRPAEFERFWSACERAPTALVSVTEPVDATTEIGLALIRILVTFAGLESTFKGQRLRARWRELAEQGRPFVAAHAYGINATWTAVEPTEAAMVREAAARVIAGDSLRGITRDWDRRGVPTRTGGPWSSTVLRNILLSPAMAGDRRYRGRVVARDCWPAVLDRVTAAKVIAVLCDPGRPRPPRTKEPLLLTGLVRCARCRSRMHSATSYKASRGWRCPTCPAGRGVSLGPEPATAMVIEAVLRRIARRGVPVPTLVPALPDDVAAVAAYTANAERLRELAVDYYARHRISTAEYQAARTALVGILAVATRRADPQWRDPILSRFGTVTEIRRRWPSLSRREQRDILTSELEAVDVVRVGRVGGVFRPDRLVFRWWHPIDADDDLCDGLGYRTTRPPLPRRRPVAPAATSAALMAPEWMTIEAASDVLGGGLKGVLTRAARNGQLPSQQFGRHRYIHERGLSDYIEGCRIDHVQAPTSPRPSPASLIDNATSGAQP